MEDNKTKIYLAIIGLLLILLLTRCQSSDNQSSQSDSSDDNPVVVIIEQKGSNWVPDEDAIPDMEYKFD